MTSFGNLAAAAEEKEVVAVVVEVRDVLSRLSNKVRRRRDQRLSP
jgi:hypothetical protein